MLSPSFESSTRARAEVQKSNDRFSRATSLSLESSGVSLGCSGAGVPAIQPHIMSLPPARCSTTCPKLICAGVGLYPYLAAGISSADSTRLRAARAAVLCSALAIGFWACTPAQSSDRVQHDTAREAKKRLMTSSGWESLGVCPRSAREARGDVSFRRSEWRRPMAAVSIERLVQELEKLKQELDAGKLKSGDYDQRLARAIRELRERGLEANRAQITAALDDALRRGIITSGGRAHLERRLGLT